MSPLCVLVQAVAYSFRHWRPMVFPRSSQIDDVTSKTAIGRSIAILKLICLIPVTELAWPRGRRDMLLRHRCVGRWTAALNSSRERNVSGARSLDRSFLARVAITCRWGPKNARIVTLSFSQIKEAVFCQENSNL
jgi:hypothetical protein